MQNKSIYYTYVYMYIIYIYTFVLRRRLPDYIMSFVKFNFNPLKPKLIQIIFKNSVQTAKKTQHYDCII
jgi:hypothetical protein